jgi:poly(A) polymerase
MTPKRSTPVGSDNALTLASFEPRLALIAQRLASNGTLAHVFGGAVRDALVGTRAYDLDMTVDGSARDEGESLAELLGGAYFDLDVERGIGRVALAGESPLTVDLTGRITADDIDAHLRGRDFTINAMAVSLPELAAGNARVIDPTLGLGDLQAGLVRALSAQAFDDDPIRLLRGPRMVATHMAANGAMTLDDQTADWIKQRAGLVSGVSPERVRDELLKILAAPEVTRSIRGLDDLGLLTAVLPELEESRGVTQPSEHHYDVFNHIVETPGMFEMMLDAPNKGPDSAPDQEPDSEGALSFVPYFEGISEYFAGVVADGATRSTLAKLACLLHDVSKPAARTVEPSGRIRFFGHGPLGAQVCRDLMARLRFSRKATEHVAAMVEYHLRPGQAAAQGDLPTARAIYRYRRDLGDVSIDTLYLNMADYMAAKGPDMLRPGYDFSEWELYCGAVERLLDGDDSQKAQNKRNKQLAPGLVNGRELMTALSLGPGPVLGELLELIEEARATGEIGSRPEALRLAEAALTSGRVTGSRKVLKTLAEK